MEYSRKVLLLLPIHSVLNVTKNVGFNRMYSERCSQFFIKNTFEKSYIDLIFLFEELFILFLAIVVFIY